MLNKKYKNIILDMDGVLWLGAEELGNLKELFERLQYLNIKYYFATNNSTRFISTYESKLKSFGVDLFKNSVYSAAAATVIYLQNNYSKNDSFYAIGSKSLIKMIEKGGFIFSESTALFVVVGLDIEISYEKIKIASNLILNGSSFIGTNPDSTYPIGNMVYPGAGSIIASVKTSSGIEPMIIGKPKIDIYNSIFTDHDINAEDTLVVGDRLDTDILGGSNAGCDTAMVLTGISTKIQATNVNNPPTYIFDSLTDLVKNL